MVVAHKNWASFSKKKKVWSSGAVPSIFENGRRALTLALKKKKKKTQAFSLKQYGRLVSNEKKKKKMVVAHKNWASFSEKKKKKIWSSRAVSGIFENGRRALTLGISRNLRLFH